MSFSTLSLLPSLCPLVFFIFLRCLLPCLPPSLPPVLPCLFFATHPYVDISLSIDPQGGIPPVALYGLLLYLSFLSIRSFLYTTSQPAFPSPPCCSTLAVSLLSIRSLQLLLLIPFDVGCIEAFYIVFRSGLGLEWFTVCFLVFNP